VESIVGDRLSQWFEEHPADGKRIIAKAAEAAEDVAADAEVLDAEVVEAEVD
jgi:DNA gyrase/topoisomerase IV subunit B